MEVEGRESMISCGARKAACPARRVGLEVGPIKGCSAIRRLQGRVAGAALSALGCLWRRLAILAIEGPG